MKKIMLGWMIACFALTQPLLAQFQPEEPGKGASAVSDINPADVIHWIGGAGRLFANGYAEIDVQLMTDQEFTIYSDKIEFLPPLGVEVDLVRSPPTKKQFDPISQKDVEVYQGGDFTAVFRVGKDVDQSNFAVGIRYVGCTNRICLFPYTEKLKFRLVPVQEDYKAAIIAQTTFANPATTNAQSSDAKIEIEARLAAALTKGAMPIYLMVFIVFLGGLLTNLTPCVAPMIPITVRLLSRQSESPLLNSSAYAFGILITYTFAGLIATWSGTAFGAFMQLKAVSIGFGIVMAMLGFSMLGFVNLTFLQVLGSRFGSGKPSVRNSFLMGAGAGLVAAPCTGPVLGALLTFTAGQQSPSLGVLLMTSYSFGFALPYVFLGLAANSASKVRVSPQLQVGIKVVFAAVMFALSFYYFRIAAYDLLQMARPFMNFIALTGVVLGGTAMVVAAVTPSLQNNKMALALPCLLCGLGLFAFSQWFTTSDHSTSLKVYTDRAEAIRTAGELNKPILIDNWAEWCEACKKMDVTTFVDPRVVTELQNHWIVLKFDLTESNVANDKHLEEFAISGLPTLIMLPPNSNLAEKADIVGYASADLLLERLHAFKGQ